MDINGVFFNAPYDNCDTDYSGKGVDQLKYIIDTLMDEKNRNSRRIILCAWNLHHHFFDKENTTIYFHTLH